MRLALADLLCQSCGGYVHPFFDRCPACGSLRPSHAELLDGSDLGAASMAADPAVTKAAADSIRRTTTLLALRGMGSRAGLGADPETDESVDAAQMIDFVGGMMTYRVFGLLEDPATPIGAGIHVAAGALVLNATRGGRHWLRFRRQRSWAPSRAAARRGGPCRATGHGGKERGCRRGRACRPGDLLVIHAADRVASAFSIANPSGIFGTRARVDHYEELARWIGLLAITHAEARWQEIGAAPYAAELGLVQPRSSTSPPGVRTQLAGRTEPRRPFGRRRPPRVKRCSNSRSCGRPA